MPAVEDLARNFFAGDEALANDPYPVYKVLRKRCPVARSERFGGYWVLSTYEDVQFVYRNPEIFSSNPALVPPGVGQSRPLIPLETDPPEHTKYRRIISPQFVPRKMVALEPQVRDIVNQRIDTFIGEGRCDFMQRFALPVPTEVFVRLMGWPVDDARMFNEWTETFVRGVPDDPEASQQVRGEAGAALYGYFAEQIAARRKVRTGDFTSALVDAEYDKERPLTDEEILDIIMTVMIGGLDTTKSVLGFSMLYLADHPVERDRLATHPELIASAVEEFLRWQSPAAAGRRVLKDVTIRGQHMKAGDLLVMLTGSASRDEAVFDHPDEVILDREPNRHMAFGDGAHRCPGAIQGRLVLRIALEELHRRIPDYYRPGDAPLVLHTGHLRGVDELTLAFTPRPPSRLNDSVTPTSRLPSRDPV